MRTSLSVLCIVLMSLVAFADEPTTAPTTASSMSRADDAPRVEAPAEKVRSLHSRIAPSLVAVQYTWEAELRRQELVSPGLVVSKDGLILCPIAAFNTRIPDDQMKEFKIILPQEDADPVEIDAVFCGRDERTNLAFVKPASSGEQKWTPLQFVDEQARIGETVYSVGILPKGAGYRAYINRAAIGAKLRGEVPMYLVDGSLTAMGSPVFNENGQAIGLVNYQQDQPPILNDPRSTMAAVNSPPKMFTPFSDFAISLTDPPKAGEPMRLPWVGVPQFTGLKKEVAEFFDLVNRPAVEVSDVIPNSPAEKGGLKRGMIIVKLDGQPLERGDEPEELPMILRRQLLRKKVGDTVTLSVITRKAEPLNDIVITTGEQPKRESVAARFYSDDLGFGARELVFSDTYAKRLPSDFKGVLVTVIKPSSSAAAAKLQRDDVIIELNGHPFEDLKDFQKRLTDYRTASPREAVVMVVQREGNTQVIRMEPPQ